ncbi:hypothetical protein ACIRRA_19850, partial [Nocardia sp. NPDC101769]
SLGFAVTVIAVFLLIADRFRPLTFPLAAVGAVPLTVYSAHIVAIWLLDDHISEEPSNTLLVVFLAITVAMSVLWVLAVGRGPLERGVSWLSDRATARTRRPSAA